MKQLTSSLVLVVSLVFFMSSCCMQKRRYMGGYHLVWNRSGLALQHQSTDKHGEKTATVNSSQMQPQSAHPSLIVQTSMRHESVVENTFTPKNRTSYNG